MYLLDTSALIEPNTLWYGLDFCPAYWQWLIKLAQEGEMASTTEIRSEITKDDTEQQRALLAWVHGDGKELFQKITYSQDDIHEVSQWVRAGEAYRESAMDDFMKSADPYLVAEALARGRSTTIVSREVTGNPHSAPKGTQHKVKLPDVCAGVGIRCIQPYEMLRESKPVFRL